MSLWVLSLCLDISATSSLAGMGYWVQASLALVLGAALVSLLVNLVEDRFGGGLAALVALMVLPETVLFFHFILFPRITELFAA